jgi:uracil-DNA glycosylase
MTAREFIAALAAIRLPSVFNPYADICDVFDRPNAPKIRRTNLQIFLEAALKKKVRTIWIARDLGHRGGRRTGIPMTDEIHLDKAGALLDGIRLRRATKGPAMAERTAAVVWRVLSEIEQPVLLWNVFPFHPHDPNDSFSNRCHTKDERSITMPLLMRLIEMIRAERLVAIGRDAQQALHDVDISVSTVRHPSYGGQSEFISALHNLYGLGARDAILFPSRARQ